ncbi:MAG: 30S ribosome-binding factor RbfA [Litorivicinaceae bacterium]|jgi:ribosome-binding factor A|nr:30S ribosome-binding factor RbfA [Litorivicinaceae bacterium]MDP5328827.1 30S ribosome-binding factor RbfA [Litorivicinaceae bacterium]MDP5330295.1 30S ribosome-binding factor RbfA [Litorivicinaceae bacterium]MDP5340377.1 30S ribosome-binding factor RbfA [Litorivicinaceae bacterium]MDP5341880.1 30S ribosome-binding factor RbfA [Litorivicinaceae bacterium]
MPAEFSRTQRLGEQIQRDLATLIQRELKDPRLGMVTVNFVKLSKDLSYADVNVTVLVADDAPERIAASLAILNQASTFLRTELGRGLKVRKVPNLRFHYDDSLKRGADINALIHQARAKDQGR